MPERVTGMDQGFVGNCRTTHDGLADDNDRRRAPGTATGGKHWTLGGAAAWRTEMIFRVKPGGSGYTLCQKGAPALNVELSPA